MAEPILYLPLAGGQVTNSSRLTVVWVTFVADAVFSLCNYWSCSLPLENLKCPLPDTVRSRSVLVHLPSSFFLAVGLGRQSGAQIFIPAIQQMSHLSWLSKQLYCLLVRVTVYAMAAKAMTGLSSILSVLSVKIVTSSSKCMSKWGSEAKQISSNCVQEHRLRRQYGISAESGRNGECETDMG
jgi:hypothetical protein